jgi:hypothetical protein
LRYLLRIYIGAIGFPGQPTVLHFATLRAR